MTRKKSSLVSIPQPIKQGFMLEVGALFWRGSGRLYIGYAPLSVMHDDDEPVWDPVPIPVNAIVETCGGYFQLSNIFQEGPPYFRKYAEVRVGQIYKPRDYGDGFLKQKINQGEIPICEQFVLRPNCLVRYQWQSRMVLRQFVEIWSEEARLYERKIKRSPSIHQMRYGKEEQRIREEFKEDPNCTHDLLPK